MKEHGTTWLRILGCILILLLSIPMTHTAPAPSEAPQVQEEIVLEPESTVASLPDETDENRALTSDELRDLFSRAAERLASGQIALEQRLQEEAASIPDTPRESTPELQRLVKGAAQRLTDPKYLNKRHGVPPSRRFFGPKYVHHHHYPPAVHHHAPVYDSHGGYGGGHNGYSGGHTGYGGHGGLYYELDEDARSRSAVLNAMWRALKSATGGALAIGGTLARNSGALLQAKGRLMASTGPLVVALGKQVAEDALHPHYRELGPSHEELEAAANAAIAQRQHAKYVFQDLYQPFYESTTQLGSALRVAASGTARALGDLVSELLASAKRAYLLKA